MLTKPEQELDATRPAKPPHRRFFYARRKDAGQKIRTNRHFCLDSRANMPTMEPCRETKRSSSRSVQRPGSLTNNSLRFATKTTAGATRRERDTRWWMLIHRCPHQDGTHLGRLRGWLVDVRDRPEPPTGREMPASPFDGAQTKASSRVLRFARRWKWKKHSCRL